jgi:hypothetical protein
VVTGWSVIEDVIAEELQAAIGQGWWASPVASASTADESVALDTYEPRKLRVPALEGRGRQVSSG